MIQSAGASSSFWRPCHSRVSKAAPRLYYIMLYYIVLYYIILPRVHVNPPRVHINPPRGHVNPPRGHIVYYTICYHIIIE